MIQHLTSIVAIDQQGAIGCKNRLPWSIKSDMAFFRKTTSGNCVVMGRKTHESIGGPLCNRKNVVLSHSSVLFPSTDDNKLANSIEEALTVVDSFACPQAYVVGGAATYDEFAPLVDRYLVTMVDHIAVDADAFLSNEIRAELEGWQAHEIAKFVAEPGRDEFAFRIMAFDAPDAYERQELRKAMIHQYRHLGKRVGPRVRRTIMQQPASQTAFSF